MIPLFTDNDFKIAKSNDLLLCKCSFCKKTFFQKKHYIQSRRTNGRPDAGSFCSKKCQRESRIVKINVICTQCGKNFKKLPSQIRKSKSKNNFCSQSCGAIYQNTHKTKGIRRSKLEIYLENKLNNIYPNLKINYNETDAIDAELDIYIPSLKLAFELNGIFHYEPIYGKNKLHQIQNNDTRKFQACIEKNIELCIIDTSAQKYFKEQSSQKFLNIITEIIDNKN
jgi:hypothetical protein